MMQHTIETYLNLDELESKSLCEECENENTLLPILNDVQLRYDQLQERIIALKTITETLKDQITTEKKLWYQELQETLAIEQKFRERNEYESGDKLDMMSPEDFKMKYQIFKDFVFFTNATKNMEKIVKKHNYQQWLYDVENKCNMELLKIKQSMIILKPLKAMVSKWNEETGNDAGDHISTDSEFTPGIKYEIKDSIEEADETEGKEE